MTGSTHIEMLIADGETFLHWRDPPIINTADSGRELEIHRCAQCGTRMSSQPSNALVFVAAGTLDDSAWAIPTSHIWVEKISPGVVMHDDAVQVVGQPADRQVLMDAFTKIYGKP